MVSHSLEPAKPQEALSVFSSCRTGVAMQPGSMPDGIRRLARYQRENGIILRGQCVPEVTLPGEVVAESDMWQ